MADLNIQKEFLENDVAHLKLNGFLDAHTFEQLDEEINQLFEENRFKIVVELSGLEYISSAGAGVFIGAIGTAQDNSGNIVLVSPTENVREVFSLLGLVQIFPIHDSVSEAVEEF